MITTLAIRNNQTIPLQTIPVLSYEIFLEYNIGLSGDQTHHCVNYFGFLHDNKLTLICCIANDKENNILISSSVIDRLTVLPSFTNRHLSFQIFEREIHENFGIKYSDHPWLKPIRFPFNRLNNQSRIENYPFYQIESEELHEVGVGPIHAGVIEPGHFRFICNGEQILHLEIQLGYQHRGIEQLFLNKKKLLQRTTLAESIAGDTVAGHTIAFVNLWESLCNFQPTNDLRFIRTLALELERIAIHTGDLSAICTDIGYQLGSAVFGRLRTPIINFFQQWCGNRMAKGLLRVGYNHFNFSDELAEQLTNILSVYESDFDEMWEELHSLPSALGRLEKTGIITNEQATLIGTVGMSARMLNITRDIRVSHPHDLYTNFIHSPVLKNHGDVYARTQIRYDEIKQSLKYVREFIKKIPNETSDHPITLQPQSESFTISLIEGWRGEICHCAITDEKSELQHYKIKDPSLHNWLALALSVRNNEISDFPLSNKSFDLSYCGNDL